MPRNPDTDAFWQAFRDYARLNHDNYVIGSFGDSPETATELADLVIAGIKRATVSLARDYNARREPMPKPGDFAMMLDGDGVHGSSGLRQKQRSNRCLGWMRRLPGTKVKGAALG